MKVESFLRMLELKNENEQEEFIKARIKNQYVPIAKKKECAERIVITSFGASNKIDSVYKYILTCMALLDLYTDFDYNNQPRALMGEFDKFNELGLFDMVLNAIDEKEIKELNMVIDMCYNDYMYKQESDMEKLTRMFVQKMDELIEKIR